MGLFQGSAAAQIAETINNPQTISESRGYSGLKSYQTNRLHQKIYTYQSLLIPFSCTSALKKLEIKLIRLARPDKDLSAKQELTQ